MKEESMNNTYKNFLLERVLNLFTPEEKKEYADEVWEILQKSYSKIGGFKSATDADDLVGDSWLWKVVRRNGKISAVNIYKDKNGRKSIAVGTDGTAQGKKDFYMVKDDDINLGRSWAEVSGAAEHIMLKGGAKPIPNKYAAILTKKEIVEYNPDGFHYTRLIQGHPHEKIIVGAIDLDPTTAVELKKSGINLEDLPKNIRF